MDVKTGNSYEFLALTWIDWVTGLEEFIRMDDKTDIHIAIKFKESWLLHHPETIACLHANGGAFNIPCLSPQLLSIILHSNIHSALLLECAVLFNFTPEDTYIAAGWLSWSNWRVQKEGMMMITVLERPGVGHNEVI